MNTRCVLQDATSLICSGMATNACSVVADLFWNGHGCMFSCRLNRRFVDGVFARKSCYRHITPVLVDLHWLPVHKQFDFKIATTVYRVLHYQQSVSPKCTSQSLQSSSSITVSAARLYHRPSKLDSSVTLCHPPNAFQPSAFEYSCFLV